MLNKEDRINSRLQLNEWLKYEKSKYKVGGIKLFFGIGENTILYKHQLLLRKTEYHINSNHKIRKIIYSFRLNKYQNKYALHIPVNCCGKGLKIMHVGPVLMNGKVTVGRDCSFHINTALVAGGGNDDVPTLGNGVIVGIGAVVVGGVTLADNIAIGANAVVNKSFNEEDIAIAGVPAKKISENGANSWRNRNS